MDAMPRQASEAPSSTSSQAALLADLDDEQREAVCAPRGPVCVLAGAGTGKTRTITRRIAHLVGAGHVAPNQVLAVTFTQRAAGEMRSRLRALERESGEGSGTGAVQAMTFHAAARRQLQYFWPRLVGDTGWELLDSKFGVVATAASRAAIKVSTDDVRDLAGEIEWAKSSLISPEGYAAAVAKSGRDIPLDAATVATVYAGYEAAKARRDGTTLLDFDDLLLHTAAAIENDASVASEFRDRYRCFVVDEYQDVTPLQQRVLDAWLGERDDLTVVGDANQTIYSFTGATPGYLLDFSRRFPDAAVVRLERDYRSTPQVVSLANRVISAARGRMAGSRLHLVGQRAPGPTPTFNEQHLVANGASELLAEVFGDRGKHARSAFGAAQIPFGSCVEIELIAEVADGQSKPPGWQAAFANDAGTLSEKFTGLARVMSGKYDWKPAQGVRSVADVFNLIVKENGLLAGVLSGTANTGASPAPITDPENMQEALKASYLNLQKAIAALSDNDLQAPVKLFGRDMTKQSGLMLVLEDQHEHLGQSIVYARSNGVVPPWSK